MFGLVELFYIYYYVDILLLEEELMKIYLKTLEKVYFILKVIIFFILINNYTNINNYNKIIMNYDNNNNLKRMNEKEYHKKLKCLYIKC